MAANDYMVGETNHYKTTPGQEEHWDRVMRLGLNYLQGNATKYIERCYLKGQTLDDLKKAKHYIQKLIELEEIKSQHEIKGEEVTDVDICGVCGSRVRFNQLANKWEHIG